jgi:hypothetical protein|tara:strand:- start:417 stop:1538 length:1122 start_codon:yes stop_codon:yes gene_type:complete
MADTEQSVAEEEPPWTLQTSFGAVEVFPFIDDETINKNLRALCWIEEIVAGSNGALTYQKDGSNRLISAHIGEVKIAVDPRLCVERSLGKHHWGTGHVPAFVNGHELCIEMEDVHDPDMPDVDLCVSLILLLSAEGVKPAMLPSTLYPYLPLREVGDMLSDSDCVVVETAIQSLGGRSCKASLTMLKKAVHQASSAVFTIAAIETLLMGRHVNSNTYMPLIVELTNSNEMEVKVRAVEMLGLFVDVGKKEYIPVLKRLLHFDNESVPVYLLGRYAEMAGAEAIEDLVHILLHKEPSWHEMAVRGLASIGDPVANQALAAYAMIATDKIQSLILKHFTTDATSSAERAVADFLLALKGEPAPIQDLSDLFSQFE